jgi:hypothetical protein
MVWVSIILVIINFVTWLVKYSVLFAWGNLWWIVPCEIAFWGIIIFLFHLWTKKQMENL